MDSHFFGYIIIVGLFLLLPLIPSILVYKVSPKDKIGVGGIFHAFTINATGAFAGYLICCLFLYFFVLEGFIEHVNKKENYKNDDPSLISQQVLLFNNWEGHYAPTSGEEYVWKYNIKFLNDSSGNIILNGKTQRRKDNIYVDIIEWKSEHIGNVEDLTRNIEMTASMRWLEGAVLFDSSIVNEVNKWNKGKIRFESDYFLRGEFEPDADPSKGWGIWLYRPPQ